MAEIIICVMVSFQLQVPAAHLVHCRLVVRVGIDRPPCRVLGLELLRRGKVVQPASGLPVGLGGLGEEGGCRRVKVWAGRFGLYDGGAGSAGAHTNSARSAQLGTYP